MLVKDKWKRTWYGEEITETEYNEILSMLRSRPDAPEGYAYRLTKDLVWEQYELPPDESDPELSEAEMLEILLGGAV
jgi:hypothetical protein